MLNVVLGLFGALLGHVLGRLFDQWWMTALAVVMSIIFIKVIWNVTAVKPEDPSMNAVGYALMIAFIALTVVMLITYMTGVNVETMLSST